jgi:serine/threonine-protein kinase
MQNYVGKQIDRYRITKRLGKGGMAIVYKAYDTRLERDVALKLIRTEAIPEEQHERLLKRFEREAKAQARFDHKHIVHIYDYGEVDGSPYLVMAYISGGTLKERLHRPVTWRQAVRWLIPVAEALAYAHKRGIVHRDIKPANILFDEESQPILTDFGIAKVLETDEATLTGTGLGVGTPEYMAPEQWQGKTSAASDQYALGVVLYELITGCKPYSADTPAAIILMQANEPLAPPSGLVKNIPASVEKTLYKVLARDPQDRYENMDEFALALRELLADAKAAEPIPPQKNSAKPESAPTSETTFSENVTRDALDVTPVEEMDTAPSTKQMLPKWAKWTGIGVVLFVLLGLAIGIGGNLVDMGRGGEGPLAMLATETPTVKVAPTMTITSTLSKTPTITPMPKPTLGIGSTMINEKDGAEMVFVPAGEFQMGSENAEARNDEAPEHTVYLDAYWIYKYEVTNAQYRLCIEDKVCSGDLFRYPENDYPATYIDWHEATAYCEWAGGRLPAEAEWEKAARGTDGRTYPWGEADPTCSMANHGGRPGYGGCEGDTEPVGHPDGASPYGASDMAGNVWEWTADWYDPNYYQNSPALNPTGPINGSVRVVRGGFWISKDRDLRASNRSKSDPDYPAYSFGIRCLSSATP